jgi:hypothetical protein
MACDRVRFKKQKYCDADFRHIIDINLLSTSSDFNNNVSSYVKESMAGIYSIIVDRTSYIQYISGDAISADESHKIIIKYYTEFESFISNPQAYRIIYNDKQFKATRAVVENLDNLYIIIYANLFQRS